MLKTKIAIDLYNAIQILSEADTSAIPVLPQTPQKIANSNPRQPLPGQTKPQPPPPPPPETQVVGSSGGNSIASTGEPLTIDLIIDRFNIIRGGKSFADPEVYAAVANIFNALSEKEKSSLEKILRIFGEIVTGPEDPNQVVNTLHYQEPLRSQQATPQAVQTTQTNVQAAAPQANIPPVSV